MPTDEESQINLNLYTLTKYTQEKMILLKSITIN